MQRVLEGRIEQASGPVAIVVSRYNESITENLLHGALTTLTEHGVADHQITVARVPGAWEIPIVVRKLADAQQYRAIIALGAVIKGDTTHDEYINHQLSQSLGRIALESGVPTLFGILTCQTLEQAIHRSGGKVGNKGSECAEAALLMIDLMSQLD